MKANIPPELETAIYEYIYQRMLVEVLNNKLSKDSAGSNTYKILEVRYKMAHKKLIGQKANLKENKIKVDPMEDIDDMFSRVRYFVKMERGYKEGEFRFWKAALKMELKRRFRLL